MRLTAASCAAADSLSPASAASLLRRGAARLAPRSAASGAERADVGWSSNGASLPRPSQLHMQADAAPRAAGIDRKLAESEAPGARPHFANLTASGFKSSCSRFSGEQHGSTAPACSRRGGGDGDMPPAGEKYALLPTFPGACTS
eukprot:360269-Chlamydomonas_euryale.AAC.7